MLVRLLLSGLFLLLAGPAPGRAASVVRAEFVVMLRDGAGNQAVVQSNIVPLLPDRACYGWRIRLAGATGVVSFKEIFSIPAEPATWSGEKDEFSPNVIAKDRKTAVTEKFAMPLEGWISHSWCVAAGDPAGNYSMDVHIEGKFAKRFDFEVRRIPALEK